LNIGHVSRLTPLQTRRVPHFGIPIPDVGLLVGWGAATIALDRSRPGGSSMKCSNCQHTNEARAKFCEECAAPLTRGCSNCGRQLSPTAKFCPECAHPTGHAPAPTTSLFGSPGAYTPRHLVEKILTSRSALEGERKQVTVLFADLKGSMELLADRDAEEARNVLDPVLQLMMDAVHRYEGTVNQVMGDGIMALFGAPLAHEDHAVRACYAAIRMQETVKQYAEDARRSRGAVIQIRVGLNSGEVVVRAIGSDLRMDYTAVGQITHLAARMEQLADPGAIVITPSTLALAEGYVEVKSLGLVPIKGLPERVEIYEVVCAGPARTRLQAATRRGLTRFVGREREIAELRRVQQLTGGGRGQVAAIIGEAGVGKSRLVYEFTHSHRLEGWLVLESSSVSYGKATSYLPAIDLLKSYFKIQDRDDYREVREKVTGKLFTLDESLKLTLPALLALLDVPVDDVSWQQLDSTQRRLRTLDAIKRLILREAKEQPLLVIFEDLHWIDGETQALLDSLVDSLASSRMLLLVDYRPQYEHRWSNRTYYSQMRLDALPAESVEELLQALVGDHPSLEPLKQLLIRRGNPFFLEESVRALIETKALEGERGRFRLIRPVQSLQVPPTVQVILASRIDRLSAHDKRLLQIASVIGKEVSFELLQDVSGLPDETLRQLLINLQVAEFIYETHSFPELVYTFKHALTLEVTYKSLPLEARRSFHERIARSLESSSLGRFDEKSEILSHHYQQAGNDEKALEYLLRAARRATTRFTSTEALGYCAAVNDCLNRLPRTEARDRQRIDIRLAEAEMLWFRGRYKEALGILQEIQDLAEHIPDNERLARIHFTSGWLLYDQVELDRAYSHNKECLRLCQRLGCVQSMRRVYWGLGRSCRVSSEDVGERRTNAIAYHEAGLHLAEEATSAEFFDVHNAQFLWLIYLFQLGDWTAAMRYLERAEAMARKLPESLHVALMMGSKGFSGLLKQRSPADFELLRTSLAAADEAGSHIYRIISHYLLGQSHFLVGEYHDALTHFETALGIAGQTGRGNLFQPGLLLWAAEAEAKLGLLDDALDRTRRYDELAQRVGPLEGLAWFPSRGVAYRVRGVVLAKQRAFEAASSQFAKSLELLAAHGYKPDLARTLVAIGECELEHGRNCQAHEALVKALGYFKEMGFTLELQQTQRLLETT
jgi:class 3 adenylate cyclase/tetratricopeptide (TPR) repeat protein